MPPSRRTGPTVSMATVRFVIWPLSSAVGPAPIESSNCPRAELTTAVEPKKSEIQPSRIGELMSPNRWIRKMNKA